MIVVLNKPFGVLSRFTDDGSNHQTLANLKLPPQVYPVGRLDADSEGLLLLSDEKGFADALLHPSRGHPREYWAQVEGVPDDGALRRLKSGVSLKDGLTKRAEARIIDTPDLPERDPPVRFRESIPTTWISLVLTEGKNRQVRRMTAAVGFPTLRLVRVRIGRMRLGDLAPGTWRTLDAHEIPLLFR